MKITVYGLGHLGLPLATVLARAGYDVVGVDPNLRPELLKTHEPNTDWEELPNICFTDEPKPSDVSFVVVPTPSLEDGSFDDQYVEKAIAQIKDINERHTAVVVSTLSPGSCDALADKYQSRNFYLIYNPTFIAVGDVVRGLTRPDLLLIGGDDLRARNLIASIWESTLHAKAEPRVYHGSFLEVELLKLSVNCVLATKISIANSLGQLFKAYGISEKPVSLMGFDPRIGRGYLLPGSPITGPCLPRDNKALQAAAARVGVSLPISEATEEVQGSVYQQLVQDIISSEPKSVGILGLTYKYGTDITTDAVGAWLKELLATNGIPCVAYDSVIESDRVEDVARCDVVVVTQKEFHHSPRDGQRVINLWP